jgi:GT2 family glycosyltransferase
MHRANPTCAALILHHDGCERLPPLYESLLSQDDLTAVCLIDNASNDGSVEMTRRLYPSIEILHNGQNLDFGKAYNRAIALRNEDVIFIVNDDIVVLPGSIRRALDFLAENPDVATVSFNGVDPTPGSPPFPCSCPAMKRFGKLLSAARCFAGPCDPPAESPYCLAGAACCIRRDVFMKVKFDEHMDWYFEDIDLGWSISRHTGMRNVVLPGAMVYHAESCTGTRKFGSNRIWRMSTRNAAISFAKNGTAWDLMRAFPYLCADIWRLARRVQLACLLVRILAQRVFRAPAGDRPADGKPRSVAR